MEANVLGQRKSPQQGRHSNNGLAQTIWHKSAPGAIRKAFRSGRESKAWSAWRKHLAARRRPLALRELLPGRGSPLFWVLPDGVESDVSREVLAHIDSMDSRDGSSRTSAEKLVRQWLSTSEGVESRRAYALEALFWSHGLPGLAGKVSSELWWELLDQLVSTVIDAGDICLDEAPLIHQWLAGELPLTLAYLFPEITACRKLARQARRALSAGLVDLLDGEGLPHANHLGEFRPLLACWTRCRAVGNELSKGCWSKKAQVQYEWLVRHALRLSRSDGTHLFAGGTAGAWCQELFTAALRFSDNEEDDDIAALVLPGKRKADAARISRLALPEAAYHSEWAATGVLRAGWTPSDPWLTVTYPDDAVRIELECRRGRLFSGVWEFEVRRNGRPAAACSDWRQLCWVSDDDADYLELEIELVGGLRIERHLLLARDDHFLFLADAILGDRRAALEYRGRLPLAEGISFRPAEETREGFLAGRRRAGLVLPLALPEWRVDGRIGSLTEEEGGLKLHQASRGRSMFAPLFLDLRPRRMTRRLTWRQLTVAQSLETQPDDVAVGYRVKVGKAQWLIYRSLGRRGNRTLLGHNLATEMLVARFDEEGEVEPLLEIESD